MCEEESEKRTEDDGDDDGLDVLRGRLVGVTGEISDIQAECGVVAQNSVHV